MRVNFSHTGCSECDGALMDMLVLVTAAPSYARFTTE